MQLLGMHVCHPLRAVDRPTPSKVKWQDQGDQANERCRDLQSTDAVCSSGMAAVITLQFPKFERLICRFLA